MIEDRISRAMVDPALVFSKPHDVVGDDSIPKSKKIEILRRWEYDAREIQVADEEGLGNPSSGKLLDDVIEALHELGAGLNLENTPPTKQGGV